MIALLTVPVLLFQALIFFTILGSGRVGGKSLLILTTLCWCAFTVFGAFLLRA